MTESFGACINHVMLCSWSRPSSSFLRSSRFAVSCHESVKNSLSRQNKRCPNSHIAWRPATRPRGIGASHCEENRPAYAVHDGYVRAAQHTSQPYARLNSPRIVSCPGTSASESLSAAGNIFVGQTEAPLLVKPFVKVRSNVNAGWLHHLEPVHGCSFFLLHCICRGRLVISSADVVSRCTCFPSLVLAAPWPGYDNERAACGHDWRLRHDRGRRAGRLCVLRRPSLPPHFCLG